MVMRQILKIIKYISKLGSKTHIYLVLASLSIHHRIDRSFLAAVDVAIDDLNAKNAFRNQCRYSPKNDPPAVAGILLVDPVPQFGSAQAAETNVFIDDSSSLISSKRENGSKSSMRISFHGR